MDSNPEVPLKIQTPSAEAVVLEDGDFFPSASVTTVEGKKPGKKQTRQWAAWTRREEENFFNALRQVGKNFEKITSRVQSKNKDQVRHYYYRLVRRINKLLGPGYCLDAKNSKDTNAAMLRWWSLLEKYSCTASKLHLKPRRFKIFVEALEQQLLKDRNKTRKSKQSPQGESFSSNACTRIANKAHGNDTHPVKLIFLDTQSTYKIRSSKVVPVKCNVTANMEFREENVPTLKSVRQKRKSAGMVASSAYKRWEKAAMAGVSLVADAAEQLERAANDDRNCSVGQGGQIDMDSSGTSTCPLPPSMLRETCSHDSRETSEQVWTKLKLQLFPVDEDTRKALEKDTHNPHLELTLSARKRISSVLQHLTRKWGTSSIASGELVLLPFNVRKEDMPTCQRWTTKDTLASAADVYAAIGSPATFQLRYGWLADAELRTVTDQAPSEALHFGNSTQSKDIQEGHSCREVCDRECTNADATEPLPNSGISEQFKCSDERPDPTRHSIIDMPEHIRGYCHIESAVKCMEFSRQIDSPRLEEESDNAETGKQKEDLVHLGTTNDATFLTGEWADSLTNMSVGDLFSEASKAAASCCISSADRIGPCLQQMQFSYDSFDAAVAAHLSGHQLSDLSSQVYHSSIWNDEEARDEFSFKAVPSLSRGDLNPPFSTSFEACGETCTSSLGFHDYIRDLTKGGSSDDHSCDDMKFESESSAELISDPGKYDAMKDLHLGDSYWPDSLGSLDLDMPPSRYREQDALFGESVGLSCLSHFIASSLDAFQNLSFSGVDRKDSLPSNRQDSLTGEFRGASISLDYTVAED